MKFSSFIGDVMCIALYTAFSWNEISQNSSRIPLPFQQRSSHLLSHSLEAWLPPPPPTLSEFRKEGIGRHYSAGARLSQCHSDWSLLSTIAVAGCTLQWHGARSREPEGGCWLGEGERASRTAAEWPKKSDGMLRDFIPRACDAECKVS